MIVSFAHRDAEALFDGYRVRRLLSCMLSKSLTTIEVIIMPRKLPPLHPGEILREEYMRPYGLSSNALAAALGVTAARINEIANERRGVTADTALRLARYFGGDVRGWLNLQQNYELECAVRAIGNALKAIRPRVA
jgi:addiction module HigA family antidote